MTHSPRMARARSLLKPVLSAAIVLCTAFFFYRAFQRNWASIRAHEFQIEPIWLVASALGILGSCLLATLAWYTAMNALGGGKLDLRQSIAAVNASSLTKYIPGKVWSYALQIYWLNGLGFSKALVVYVNLVNLLISLGMSLMLGLLCLLMTAHSPPLFPVLGALTILLLIDACSIAFNRPLLHWLVRSANRLFKREFSYFDVTRTLLLELHAIHFLAAVVSGVSIYLFCFAIGYHIELRHALGVIASSLISDVVGFLAIIVPGGLGVREATMYAILGGQATGSLALVLPIASRLLNMVVDVLLGAVAFRLLRSLRTRRGRA